MKKEKNLKKMKTLYRKVRSKKQIRKIKNEIKKTLNRKARKGVSIKEQRKINLSIKI